MSVSLGLIAMFIAVSFLAGGLSYRLWVKKELETYKNRLRMYAQKTEDLSSNYDDYRRKYLDLDDRYREVVNMEQTYRVAYQEWKTKYEDLQNRPVQQSTDNEVASPSFLDAQDEEILFKSWKRKALKLEQIVASLQGENDALKNDLAHFEDHLDSMDQMKEELRKMQDNLLQITLNLDKKNIKRKRGSRESSEVFDIKE